MIGTLVEELLEGGTDAFEMRRSKYGFRGTTTHTELLEIVRHGESSHVEFTRDLLESRSPAGRLLRKGIDYSISSQLEGGRPRIQ